MRDECCDWCYTNGYQSGICKKERGCQCFGTQSKPEGSYVIPLYNDEENHVVGEVPLYNDEENHVVGEEDNDAEEEDDLGWVCNVGEDDNEERGEDVVLTEDIITNDDVSEDCCDEEGDDVTPLYGEAEINDIGVGIDISPRYDASEDCCHAEGNDIIPHNNVIEDGNDIFNIEGEFNEGSGADEAGDGGDGATTTKGSDIIIGQCCRRGSRCGTWQRCTRGRGCTRWRGCSGGRGCIGGRRPWRWQRCGRGRSCRRWLHDIEAIEYGYQDQKVTTMMNVTTPYYIIK